MISSHISITIVVLRAQSLATGPPLVFRGFFIQARLAADDSNVGGFLSPQAGQEYQLSSCTPPTVSCASELANVWHQRYSILRNRDRKRH